MRSKITKSLVLPSLKDQPMKISAHQIHQFLPASQLRSKTEPLYQHVQNSEFVCVVRSQTREQLSSNRAPQVSRGGKGRGKAGGEEKGGKLAEIIDTRKSIKILLDYFDSKSQEIKTRNANCYHSPRKQHPKQIISAETPPYVHLKAIHLKKIKLKRARRRTETHHTPPTTRKTNCLNLKEAIKIQNVLTDFLREEGERLSGHLRQLKLEKSQREKANKSEKKPTGYAEKGRTQDMGGILQRKITKFEGWPVEHDTNYID